MTDTRKLLDRILAAKSADDALVQEWLLQLFKKLQARDPERTKIVLMCFKMNDPLADQKLVELMIDHFGLELLS